MTDEWNEKIRCPNCNRIGMASLSQTPGEVPTVQSLPDGFKVVDTQFGPKFYCRDCDVEVDP